MPWNDSNYSFTKFDPPLISHNTFKCALLHLILFILLTLMNTDPEDPSVVTENTRTLGLVVCRGTQVCLISPVDGLEEIANPFEEEEEEEEA